jgi:PAS domain-containing protein
MGSEKRGRPSPAKASQAADRSAAVDSYFASIGRDGLTELQGLLTLLRAAPLLQQTIDAMPIPVSVLNVKAQAVMVNRWWGEYLGSDADCALGKRHGELLGCIHVEEGPDGCGTSRHCQRCGAAISFVTSQQEQGQSVREYRLDRETPDGTESREFLVASTPIQVGGQSFTIVALLDIEPHRASELHQL